MIILGIDPGTATTGFGVIEWVENEMKLLDYGCIITHPSDSLAVRLNQITSDLGDILQSWKPNAVAIEELFFSKNVKTAMHVAHARGAIIERVSKDGYALNEYKPQHIKEAVCGYGKADKKQMQKMVQMVLKMNEIPSPDDAADALGIAICHASNVRFTSLL